MDGQQRTISICEYVAGKFSLNFQYFHNLEDTEKEQILDYKLMVYFFVTTFTEINHQFVIEEETTRI